MALRASETKRVTCQNSLRESTMAEHLSAAVMGRKLSSILVEAEEDAPCGSKVCCTLGPQSRSVDVLERLLCAGMTAARFDFSWGDDSYHQETLDNLLMVRWAGSWLAASHGPRQPAHRRKGSTSARQRTPLPRIFIDWSL